MVPIGVSPEFLKRVVITEQFGFYNSLYYFSHRFAIDLPYRPGAASMLFWLGLILVI